MRIRSLGEAKSKGNVRAAGQADVFAGSQLPEEEGDVEDKKLSTRDIAISSTDQAGELAERGAQPTRAQAAAPAAAVQPRQEEKDVSSSEPLFLSEESQGYRSRWDAIQTGFVDEPRKAVQEADNLVADVMKRLAGVFADERSTLEKQWSKGDQVSTEDLRVALRRYRTFFQRLLDI